MSSSEVDEFYARIEGDLALSSKVPGIHRDHHWFVDENEKIRMDLTPDFKKKEPTITQTSTPTITPDDEGTSTGTPTHSYVVDQWVKLLYNQSEFCGVITNVHGPHIEVKCMHQVGMQFRWPAKDDIAYYYASDILCEIGPPRSVGKRGWFEFERLEIL